jgi:hypothetical protein
MPLLRVLSSTAIVALALTNAATADVLKLENSNEATVVIMDNRPARGMTQGQVLELYGEPTLRNAPVGQPPISTWNYSNFSVFFEYDHVIHTVNHSAKRSQASE